jgi:hypothetical protein
VLLNNKLVIDLLKMYHFNNSLSSLIGSKAYFLRTSPRESKKMI